MKLAGGDVTVTFNTGGTATITPTAGENDNHSVFQAVYIIGAGETTVGLSPNERLEVEAIELAATGTITDNPLLPVTGENKPNNIAQDGLTPDFNLGFGPGEIPEDRLVGWNIQVDGILPYISSVTSGTPDGTYGIGELIDITINFNEAVWYTQT